MIEIYLCFDNFISFSNIIFLFIRIIKMIVKTMTEKIAEKKLQSKPKIIFSMHDSFFDTNTKLKVAAYNSIQTKLCIYHEFLFKP